MRGMGCPWRWQRQPPVEVVVLSEGLGTWEES